MCSIFTQIKTHNKEKPDSRKWTAPRPTQLAPQCRRHCQAVSFDQIWFQFSEYGKIKRSVHLIDLYFTFEKSCLTNLIFLSLLNMIFAGYTNSKIKVQNRQKKSSFSDLIQVQMLQQKIEFVQLDSSAHCKYIRCKNYSFSLCPVSRCTFAVFFTLKNSL